MAYLHPAKARPNLTVITAGLATRILFDKKRAVGVEIARGGALEQIKADREVILSAGGYGSPHLLLLSGIGPAADLAAFQIEVRGDLPVGMHLEDHPLSGLSYLTDRDTLFTAMTPANVELSDLRSALRHYERLHILRVLNQWPDKREAAKRLKLGLSSLYRKIEELGIDL